MSEATKNPTWQGGVKVDPVKNPFTTADYSIPSINNTSYLTKPVSFAGLEYGATDIDIFTEYHGQVFIFADMKYQGADYSEGQRRAFVSTVDALQEAGKEAILFRVSYNTTAGTILAADGTIADWYYNHRWYEPKRDRTFSDAQKAFIQYAINKHDFGGGK